MNAITPGSARLAGARRERMSATSPSLPSWARQLTDRTTVLGALGSWQGRAFWACAAGAHAAAHATTRAGRRRLIGRSPPPSAVGLLKGIIRGGIYDGARH